MLTNYRRLVAFAAIITALIIGIMLTTASSAHADEMESSITVSWSSDEEVAQGDSSFVRGTFAQGCKKRTVELLQLEDDKWVVIGKIVLKKKYRDFAFTFYHTTPGEVQYSLGVKARPKCGPMASSSATYKVA